MFGRRFPRRWSLYARVLAGVLLLLFLGWWFTRDVTYVSNVKVSGLETVDESYAAPLRELARDFAHLVNHLADLGYGWQAGGLPSLRAGDALTAEDPAGLVARGSLEVRRGNESLMTGTAARELGEYMGTLGWVPGTGANLGGSEKDYGTLRGVIHLEERPEGRERLWIEVTAR